MDAAFGRLLARNGAPPLWKRPPGFATLVLLILEQQVSLASARAAFAKLEVQIGAVTADRFLMLDADALRTCGFSRQKAGYCRDLARSIAAGDFSAEALPDLSDDEARRVLLDVRGIGPWTADCYLLGVLGRPDAWPTGDRALQVSMGTVFSMDEVPDAATADAFAERWRPLRGVAARMLWHDYLGGAPGGDAADPSRDRGAATGPVGSRS